MIGRKIHMLSWVRAILYVLWLTFACGFFFGLLTPLEFLIAFCGVVFADLSLLHSTRYFLLFLSAVFLVVALWVKHHYSSEITTQLVALGFQKDTAIFIQLVLNITTSLISYGIPLLAMFLLSRERNTLTRWFGWAANTLALAFPLVVWLMLNRVIMQ